MDILVIVGGFALAIIFLWLVTRNKTLLFWFGFITVFLPAEFINRFFIPLPTIVKWLPQLLLMGCTVLTIIFYRNQKLRIPANLFWIYLLFLVVALFSALYNETSIIDLIYAQRGFIFIICMIILLKSVYTKYTLDDLYTFIVKSGLAMAGVALFQRVVLVSILHIWSGDIITGTFGSDAQYLLYQLVCIIIVIAYWLTGKKLLSLSPRNTLLILIGSIAIANNKAGVLFVLAILIIFAFQVGYKLLQQHLGKMMYLLFFIFLGALAFDYLYQSFYDNAATKQGSYSYITNIDFMKNYLFGEDNVEGKFESSGRLKRGAAIEFGYELIKKDIFTLLLGMGPGATFVQPDGGGGYLNGRYPEYNIGRNTFSLLLTETGIFGLGLYFCMLFSIFFYRVINGRREHKIIKNSIVLLLFLYAPYENTIMMLIKALIIAVIVFPNIKGYVTTIKDVNKNDFSEKELVPSSPFIAPPMR